MLTLSLGGLLVFPVFKTGKSSMSSKVATLEPSTECKMLRWDKFEIYFPTRSRPTRGWGGGGGG